MILGVKWSSCVHQNPELSRISSEEQREKEIQRAPENRLKRGNQEKRTIKDPRKKRRYVVSYLGFLSR